MRNIIRLLFLKPSPAVGKHISPLPVQTVEKIISHLPALPVQTSNLNTLLAFIGTSFGTTFNITDDDLNIIRQNIEIELKIYNQSIEKQREFLQLHSILHIFYI